MCLNEVECILVISILKTLKYQTFISEKSVNNLLKRYFSSSPPKILPTPLSHSAIRSPRPSPKCFEARKYSCETGLQKKPTSSVYPILSIRSDIPEIDGERNSRIKKRHTPSSTTTPQNDDPRTHHHQQSSSHAHYTTYTTPSLAFLRQSSP